MSEFELDPDQPQVTFEMMGWSAEQRAMLAERLGSADVPHELDAADDVLVCYEEDEERVETVFDQLEMTLRTGSMPPDPHTVNVIDEGPDSAKFVIVHRTGMDHVHQVIRTFAAIVAVGALAVSALALRDMADEAQAQTVEAQAQSCLADAQVIIQFFSGVDLINMAMRDANHNGASDSYKEGIYETQQKLLDQYQECNDLPGDQYRNPRSDD
jgi:hypothetical protein